MTNRPALIGLLTIMLLMGAAIWKTRSDANDAWGHELREELLRSEAADNPGHRILNPRALEEGRREYLPTPAARAEAQEITTTWPDSVFQDAMDTVGTPHAPEEKKEDWLSRHFDMVEFTRNFRK